MTLTLDLYYMGGGSILSEICAQFSIFFLFNVDQIRRYGGRNNTNYYYSWGLNCQDTQYDNENALISSLSFLGLVWICFIVFQIDEYVTSREC